MAGNAATPGASVLSRGLAVLFAFDEAHRALSLTELARRAGLPLSTTHRLAAELVAGGALVRRPSGEFVIARRLWQIGLLAGVETGLRDVAAPFLGDIHAATRATVLLAVRQGIETLYLERLSGRASVTVVSSRGSRLPLHSTAVGKVLLAHAPEEVVDEAMRHLVRLTPYTLTQPAALRERLARVRRDGFATTTEEMTLGACSVAVPVRAAGDGDRGAALRTASDGAAPLRTAGDSAAARRTAGDGSTALRTAGDGAEPAQGRAPNHTGPVVAAIGVVVPTLKRDQARLVAALQVAAQGIGRNVHPSGG